MQNYWLDQIRRKNPYESSQRLELLVAEFQKTGIGIEEIKSHFRHLVRKMALYKVGTELPEALAEEIVEVCRVKLDRYKRSDERVRAINYFTTIILGCIQQFGIRKLRRQ